MGPLGAYVTHALQQRQERMAPVVLPARLQSKACHSVAQAVPVLRLARQVTKPLFLLHTGAGCCGGLTSRF